MSLDYPGGAKRPLLFDRVAERAQNRGVMFAQERRAPGGGRSSRHRDQVLRVLETAGHRMVDFREGVARREMRMVGGLRDRVHGPNRQSALLALAHEVFHVEVEQLLLDE